MSADSRVTPPLSISQLAITALDTALNAKVGDNEQSQADKRVQDALPEAELTAQSVSLYLQGIAASSCSEIDALIGDLCALRKKLVVDGNRIEQGIAEFTTLNQSVNRLTEMIVDSDSSRGAGDGAPDVR